MERSSNNSIVNRNNNVVNITTDTTRQIGNMKQQLSEMMSYLKDAGLLENNLSNNLKSASKTVDTLLHRTIKKTLANKFGDYGWDVKIDSYLVPVINKGGGGRRTDCRYVIRKVSWKNGPTIHEVHYFLVEEYVQYLHTTKYESHMFNRSLPGIEKRYTAIQKNVKEVKPIEFIMNEQTTGGKGIEPKRQMVVRDPNILSTFSPLPINEKLMNPVEIFISKSIHKINGREMKTQLQLVVNNPKLGIGMLHGSTYQEVFQKLQESLESVFYMRENNPESRERNAEFMKYIITASPPTSNTTVSSSSAGPGPEPLVRSHDEEEAGEGAEEKGETEAEEMKEEAEEAEHSEEGQGLSGTDQTDTHDDSIPPEEADFDMGGLPPDPESIDHNYHDDQNPELIKDFMDESGGSDEKGEDEAAEEKLEDPAEEAGETPEEEAAEEAQEEMTEEAGLGKTIDEMMQYDISHMVYS
jgi:hypothetical protein